MASLGSSIRSAARATSSAYRRLPIRWRLAGGSAALTLVILCGFAVIVGVLTTRRIQSDFSRQVAAAADELAREVRLKVAEREELLARLRALLRRRPPRGSASLVAGDLRLNPDTRQAIRGGRELDLTAREFELLEYLMRNQRIVVSRQALLDEVWGYHPFAETNTVDVFISNLRRKLEQGGEPRVLHTIRGAGYVLREEE